MQQTSSTVNLLVIRSPAPSALAKFYERLLGIPFDHHQHGGPWHYSANISDLVFEIYPLLKGQNTADRSTRLGFTIDNLDQLILELETSGVIIHQQPNYTDWGYTAVIADLDGRKIELTQKHDI